MLLSVLSAVLLILAFPRTDIWPLAWFAFIPLFYALDRKSSGASFWLAYLCGVVFFAGTLYWFIHVTWVGAILLVLYCGLYFGLFGLGARLSHDEPPLRKILFLAAFWVLLEYARGLLFSGFGWASLGHSQYKNIPFIQIADVTGVPGISFALMLFNAGIFEISRAYAQKKAARAGLILWLLVILFGVIFSYGAFRLNEPMNGQKMQIAVVQGNIPQELKWHKAYWPDIMEKYKIITLRADLEEPDLIIWPETSFPGFLGEDDHMFDLLRDFIRTEITAPVLLGTVVRDQENYFNSTVLISDDGEILKQYNKLHLVPFGEYIPFRKYMPILTDIVPIADFSRGTEYLLFDTDSKATHKMATLICFEDSVSYLSRHFVHKGANVLVNVTNDAWFKDTKMPFMHLQTAIFRSVENRRALIRAANTGVSAFIDAKGRITKRFEDKGRATYVQGYATEEVTLLSGETFFTRFGDIFTYFCFAGVLFHLLQRKLGLRKPI